MARRWNRPPRDQDRQVESPARAPLRVLRRHPDVRSCWGHLTVNALLNVDPPRGSGICCLL